MKKGLRVFINILETIVAVPFGIIGAILLTPLVILGLLVFIPISIIEDIWTVDFFEKYQDEYKE